MKKIEIVSGTKTWENFEKIQYFLAKNLEKFVRLSLQYM